MIWVAAVLAIFLFYKFVERRHKIILFKMLVGVLVVGSLSFGVFFGYSSFTKEQKNKWIEVSYSYHSSKLSKVKKIEIANNIFVEVVSSAPELNHLTDDEINFIKNILYTDLFFESETRANIIGMTKEEGSIWLDTFIEKDSKKIAQLQKKKLELENRRLSRYLEELSTDRDIYISDAKKYLYRYKLHARKKSFTGSPKLVKQYAGSMLPWEISAIDSIESLIEKQSESYRKMLSKENEYSELSIKICNNREIPLNSYSFGVSGFEYGRSTSHALKEGEYGKETRLHGDIIVKPKECTVIRWTDKYTFYDKYEISSIYGTWQKTK